MVRALAPLLLIACSTTSCSFEINGKLRPVGKVRAPIAEAQTLAELQVDNRAGSIVIRACEASKASIEVEVLLDEKRPETDFVDDFLQHIELQRTDNLLTVRSVHDHAPDARDWQLRYTIHVPAGIALRVDQIAGELDVQLPHTSDIRADLTAGTIGIAVGKVSGEVVANTESGEIRVVVTDSAPTGGCTLDCTAGTIMLTLPKGTNGRFDLAAITGDMSVASHYAGLNPQRSVTTMRAQGQVGNGGPMFHAHVISGVIRLH